LEAWIVPVGKADWMLSKPKPNELDKCKPTPSTAAATDRPIRRPLADCGART
jgi:hypothetical protein